MKQGGPRLTRGRYCSFAAVKSISGSGQLWPRGTNKKDTELLVGRCGYGSPLTHTTHTSGVQLKVLWTVAQVAARCVDAQAVDTVHRVCTFIDV